MLVFVAFICVIALSQAISQDYVLPLLDGRIVGGEPTSIEKHPYQVSLLYYSLHTCGAVIISQEYVVTAAHCTEGKSSTCHNRGGVIVKVAQVHQNPQFNTSTTDYDIGVLKLALPLSFGATISPVTLPKFNAPILPGSVSQVTGWGLLEELGDSPYELQVVEVPVVSLAECRKAYGVNRITDRMMCAGIPEGGKDTCQGDSGGPLVVNHVLTGLVSWGTGCARPNYPGVYASVPALRNYITEITGI